MYSIIYLVLKHHLNICRLERRHLDDKECGTIPARPVIFSSSGSEYTTFALQFTVVAGLSVDSQGFWF
jgi:hypothetical protein